MAARLLIVALLALAGCGDASAGNRPFLTRTFRTADGLKAHYVLFVPPNRNPDEKLPVILFLNGWGENGNDGLRQISNNFGGDMWRMRSWFPFLAVCPQCTYDAEWTPGSPNEQIALGVLDEAIREFNGDPDRVAITGASTGGTGALDIALANPDRFTAVVPISAPIHLPADKLAASGLAIWSFHNTGDTPSLVDTARSSRKRHFTAGTSPLVTEFDLPGHNAWDSAYSSPALYRWLLQQRRTSEGPTRFHLMNPQQVLGKWTSDGWKADADDLVSPAGDAPRSLTSPPFSGDLALHFDIQLAPGMPAVVKLVGEDEKTVELRLPLSTDGVARSIPPHGDAVTIDPAAQRSLRPGWNDVRIHVANGRLALTLNGWPALEDTESVVGGPFRITFLNASAKEQRLRFLRHSSSNREGQR